MKKIRSYFLILIVGFILLASISGCANSPVQKQTTGTPAQQQEPDTSAQKLNYPEKPITLIVPYAAGGGTDIGARILTKYAEKDLGQPFVVQNVEGGGAEIGISQMVRSKPDGYTIAAFNSGAILLTTMRKASYHPINDIEPICLLVSDPSFLVVRPNDTKFKTLEGLIDYAKKNPNKVTIGTSGAGSTDHLMILALNKAANVQIQPVHFGGVGEAKAAFMGGHIDAFLPTFGEVKQMLNEKTAIALAVATDQRLKDLPDIPTFKEKGIDISVSSNRGFAAPKGTPKEVIEKLAEAFKKASEDPGFIKEMSDMGLPIKFLGPQEYGDFIKQEYDFYTNMTKDLAK